MNTMAPKYPCSPEKCASDRYIVMRMRMLWQNHLLHSWRPPKLQLIENVKARINDVLDLGRDSSHFTQSP